MAPLLNLLRAIGSFFAWLFASSEYKFLKIFAFSKGSKWIGTYLSFIAIKLRDLVFHESLEFVEF